MFVPPTKERFVGGSIFSQLLLYLMARGVQESFQDGNSGDETSFGMNLPPLFRENAIIAPRMEATFFTP